MSLSGIPAAERVHIGFFGMRNAGKSSLVNAVTGQELSVVSEIKGTTTDPVQKTMELLPLGPVVIIDTPGLDDEGELGEKRIKKTSEMLAKTDIAVLVADACAGLCEDDRKLVKLLESKEIPYIIAMTKADLLGAIPADRGSVHYVSAVTGYGINGLKEALGSFARRSVNEKKIVSDLLEPGDQVILVVPVDESAPKGRLILPQQQTIRDILDSHCSCMVCQPQELKDVIGSMARKPKMVITDSQAFGRVAKDTPDDILLTSFSILFARYKGDLRELILGAKRLSELKEGDRVLISEGCTHHRQCEDIGTIKIPGWIENYTGIKPEYRFTSGGEFPEDLSGYRLIVHCGGCMLNEKQMQDRIARAAAAGVPIVNYGIAIAQMHGILKRSLSPFRELSELID
ncbi:MAG: [Oscillospiraceae bacterium]|nr:[FeFe] hydrogenase H-cluster maturation GTPase HydF [Oscillospiraceae bacterium]